MSASDRSFKRIKLKSEWKKLRKTEKQFAKISFPHFVKLYEAALLDAKVKVAETMTVEEQTMANEFLMDDIDENTVTE